MLNEAYFSRLDDFPGLRLQRLPRWAVRYERDLRQQASWYHENNQRRPVFACPVPVEPAWQQFDALPEWAKLWLNTLRFEVYWQRKRCVPRPPELALVRDRSSGHAPASYVGAH